LTRAKGTDSDIDAVGQVDYCGRAASQAGTQTRLTQLILCVKLTRQGILNCAARRFRQACRPIPCRFTAHTDGMMSHRTAAVAAALIPLISLIAAPEVTAAGPVVTYNVISDASLSSITYYDATHQLQQILNIASPWNLAFTSQDTYPVYSLSAQTTGTSVACQITVNGQVVSQRGGTGPRSLAGCSWATPR
jgi:Mycobacterium membrane protein